MYGLLGSYFLPFIPSWTEYCSGITLHLLASPCFLFSMIVSLLTTDPTILFRRACYTFTSLFTSYYPVGLQVDVLAMLTHFFINLFLKASLAHFPHLYLFWACWPTFLTCQPIFTNLFLGLPQPICSFFTSFTLMRFLLNSLSFLGPITTSFPLITFRAYWPLSQPIGFTNSFPRLPRSIYFLFTSYYSHGLTTSFLGLPRPIYFFFISFYSCKLASHQSSYFSPLGLFPYFFIIFSILPSLLLGFFCC